MATKSIAPEKPILFLFHRIKTAVKNHKQIDIPRSFTLQEYFSKNPSGWLLQANNEIEKIELNVKGYALDVLINNKLSEDQQIFETDTQWSKVRFSCVTTYDLIAWILRYGSDVVCMEPENLKDKVIRALKKTLEQYERENN